MPTDHWFTSLFQSTPDLITLLLQAAGAARSATPCLGPESPGDEIYRFEALELKAVNHRLDDVTIARIQALPQERLEALGLALLVFSGAADLAAWLAEHSR